MARPLKPVTERCVTAAYKIHFFISVEEGHRNAQAATALVPIQESVTWKVRKTRSKQIFIERISDSMKEEKQHISLEGQVLRWEGTPATLR